MLLPGASGEHGISLTFTAFAFIIVLLFLRIQEDYLLFIDAVRSDEQ